MAERDGGAAGEEGDARENKEEEQTEGAPNLSDVLWLLKTNLAGQQLCSKEQAQ